MAAESGGNQSLNQHAADPYTSAAKRAEGPARGRCGIDQA
jgi:hypothetical protein